MSTRWWTGLLGPGRALDPARDFVVCSNVLGRCYGTTGPGVANAARTRARGAARFPDVTVRDMVRLQAALLDGLGVAPAAARARRLARRNAGARVGAALPRARRGDRADRRLGPPLGVVHRAAPRRSARRSAADPRWRGGDYPAHEPPAAGLAAARQLAMVHLPQPREPRAPLRARAAADGRFAVAGWLPHHGRALVERFDAASYVALTRAMDTHDVGRDRGD